MTKRTELKRLLFACLIVGCAFFFHPDSAQAGIYDKQIISGVSVHHLINNSVDMLIINNKNSKVRKAIKFFQQ